MPQSQLRRARVAVAATFLPTGLLFSTWAARLPAIKQELGLSDGQLAIALVGLNAGAVLGLQLGGMLVARAGSRVTLRGALPALAAILLAPALAWSLVALTTCLFVFAMVNSVIDVGMNTHGVAVERSYGRPILSSLHAMHSLGGIVGAGLGALAASLGVALGPQFLVVATVVAGAAVAVTGRLLPSQADADPTVAGQAPRGAVGRGWRGREAVGAWVRGWSGRVLALGALGFCLMVAEGSAYDWGRCTCATPSGRAPAWPPPGWRPSWLP